MQQTTEQAALEEVPLSQLELRMMYFTESDPASCADPVDLDQEFEVEYDSAEYERKIAGLLHHAYKRLKAENSSKVQEWDEAIKILSQGDHYLSVLFSVHPAVGNRMRDRLMLLLTAVLVIAVLLVVAALRTGDR